MEYAQMFSFWTAWAVANATNVVTALIVLVVGWYAARIVSRNVDRLLARTQRIDNTIRPLIRQIVHYSILGLTLIIVLSQFGVQTASILAVLGAIGLAIALALQGTLSNIAAGVMLVWLRPFDVGDYIDADGIAGTVVEIGLFGARMRTYDGIYLFAPNSRLWNAKIINYSREKTRMIDMKIRVSYAADLAEARRIMLDMAEDSRVLKEPAPSVFVSGLDDTGVMLGFRVWVASSNWWAVNIEFTERIKRAFDEAGIEIPYRNLLTVQQAPAVEPAVVQQTPEPGR